MADPVHRVVAVVGDKPGMKLRELAVLTRSTVGLP